MEIFSRHCTKKNGLQHSFENSNFTSSGQYITSEIVRENYIPESIKLKIESQCESSFHKWTDTQLKLTSVHRRSWHNGQYLVRCWDRTHRGRWWLWQGPCWQRTSHAWDVPQNISPGDTQKIGEINNQYYARQGRVVEDWKLRLEWDLNPRSLG